MDYNLRTFCLYSFRSDRTFLDDNSNVNIYNLFQLAESFDMEDYNHRFINIQLKKINQAF